MIRKWDAKDNLPLLDLWLESTIHAHPFISESYWRDSVAVVRDVYLPAASTWVWERDLNVLQLVYSFQVFVQNPKIYMQLLYLVRFLG